MMRFGIVGFGRFGQLWANSLTPFGQVLVYDTITPDVLAKSPIRITSLEEVAQTDILFILVPIAEFEKTCLEIKPLLSEETLVVDCCSVKMHTVGIMRRVFSPNHQPWLATHPLFGPDSTAKNGGLAGQKIVICESSVSHNPKPQDLQAIFEAMGLNIVLASAEEHDRNMANSQGLIHFLGRGLQPLLGDEKIIVTPDFHALLHMTKMAANDSWQLFLDMQTYNIFAKEMRHTLINKLIALNKEIEQS